MSNLSITRVDHAAQSSPDVTLRRLMDGFRRRWPVFTLVAGSVVATGLAITLTTRPVYQAAVRFPLPPGPPDFSVAEMGGGASSVAREVAPYETVSAQVEALGSPALVSRAIERGGLSAQSKVLTGVIPALDKEAKSLVVAVRGYAAEPVTALANVIPLVHQEMLVEARKEEHRRRLEQAAREKATASAAAAKADRAYLAFRAAHPIEQYAAERDASAKGRVEQKSRLELARSSLASARAQVRVIRARLKSIPPYVVEETVLPNKRRARLQEDLDLAEVDRQQLLKDFRPASDEVQAIESRVASLRAMIAAEPETTIEKVKVPNDRRTALEAKLTDLEANVEAALAELRSAQEFSVAAAPPAALTDKLELQSSQLARDREAAQAVYQTIAGRLQSLKIASGRLSLPEPQFQPAPVPTTPVEPNTKRDLAITLILALALAAGVVLLLDYLDDRIYTPEETGRVSALENLGCVPTIPRREPNRLALLPSSSVVAESYRSLRSSIGFAALDLNLRRILITSPNKGEGKTLTAINLATAMALDGKRVILVDADLRSPNVHRQLEVKLIPGLADLVAGTASIAECLRGSGVSGLQVICAGSAPELPAEILNSPAFSRTLDELGAQADIVIIDSPPCLPVVDPAILSTLVDGVVVVIRAGQTKARDLAVTEELLSRARARMLGVVHNHLKSTGDSYYRTYPYPTRRDSDTPTHALSTLEGVGAANGGSKHE